MPSMVMMSPPLACIAKTVQDFTDLPSRSTVQAPQWVVSQPICGPVRLRSSRRKWIRRVRGSTRPSTVLPLTVIDTCVLGIGLSGSAGQRLGAFEGAGQHDAGHLGAILSGPA